MTTGLKVLTNSEIQTLKICPRQWWLGWYRKLSLVYEEPHGPRSLGNRVHGALAIYYDGETKDSQERAMLWLQEGIALDFEKVADDAGRLKKVTTEAKLATRMMEGYFEWLEEEGEDAYIEIVGQEQERRTPLGFVAETVVEHDVIRRPIELVDKLDIRVLDHNHAGGPARLLMDHKTVQTFADKLKTLHLDEQMKLYHLIEYLILQADADAIADEERTDGALYNMLRKVMRGPTAKPPFYMRKEIQHNLETLRTMWTRTAGAAQRIVELEARLDAGGDHHFLCPPSPSRDCSWQCDFFLVCPMFDDGSDAEGQLETQFEIKHPMAGRYTDVWGEEEKEAT